MKAQMEERIVSQPATQLKDINKKCPKTAWRKVKLGEVADFINGGSWSDKEYVNRGIPVLKVTNCKPNGFDLNDISYLPMSAQSKYSKHELKENDVIIATVGSHPNMVNSSAGRTSIVNSLVKGYYLNQNAVCVRTKDQHVLNQRFFGYYSKYIDFQHYIQMRGKGAANQMRIAIGAIKEYPMPLIPIFIQHSIATTLSRYDALIANYQRQIKLLEEAAQRLYKEWFVDLRFPGHENVNVVDGVPEGWRSYNIDDVFDIKYGKNLSTKEISSTGKYPVYGANGIIGYYNEYNCEEPVVLITSRGNGSGDVLKTYEQYTFVTNNSFVVKPKAQYSYCTLPFTFGLMCSANFRSVRTGAAQPQLTNASIHHINIVMPPCDIIKKYCSMMEADYKLVRYLRKQLTLLTESRDRLLPKLMSGEIEL